MQGYLCTLMVINSCTLYKGYVLTDYMCTYICMQESNWGNWSFCRNIPFQTLVHQICCYKYNQIDNDSFQVDSSSLLFIIICVLSNFPTITVCLLQYILHSCALDPDLKILPGGDMTEVGEKVLVLSTLKYCYVENPILSGERGRLHNYHYSLSRYNNSSQDCCLVYSGVA